jgi:pimeloyl-ACP methyl ester carboxylesterase
MPASTAESIATSIGNVAVHVTGDGPTLVLLHANPGSAHDFDAVVESFAKQHRVVAVDWPGYGESALPAATFAGALSYRACLLEVLDSLASRPGWGPFVLVGSSVGGFAALGAAHDRPNLVAGLVLVAPGGFTADNPFTRLACRTFANRRVARFAAPGLARLYLRRRTEATRNARVEARRVGRDPVQRGVFCAVWRSFLDPMHDLRATEPPRAPVLLTWGSWDPVLPALTDGRTAARVLHTDRHRFACGHEPYAELPDAWLATVLPFLDRLPTAAGQWRGPSEGEAR